MNPRRLALGLALPALLLASCASAPSTEASAGDGGRLQTVSLRKLFSKDEGLCDIVLVTRDFREPAFSWERTAILAFRKDKTILHEFVSVDRKKLGQDRLRHLMASFWPVPLRDDPTILSLMIADASAEFALATGDSDGGKGPQAGILSLDVKVRFLSIDKSGEFKLADPAAGEAAKAIASVMEPAEGKTPPPLHWRLLMDFYLAERNREGGNTARAAAGYQSIVDTAGHALQTSSEDLVRAPDDLRDVGAIAAIAKSRLEGMK